ncbi:hypothetical protein JYU29_12345 [Tianweitania sp. BSSL-BM11]|uniref:DUF3102 domain-containing protein n=1 Tax=Tianweitania aestuarii TaxID=2814886 RepID=A0ABS5RXG4_9HYPH|nr:hypothetical protein [Tianweitania aestuarii]MBS9721475.1 hypothetical protein [Tianweitania aestuarii]
MTVDVTSAATTVMPTEAQASLAPTREMTDDATSSLKASSKETTAPPLPSLEELGFIDADVVRVLKECEAEWHVTTRLDTKVVFLRGALVAKAQEVCEDQDEVERWAKGRLKVTRRAAVNYGRVHRELRDHEQRFIDAGVGATVMYEMTGAGAEKVEALLRHYEEGGSMTVQEVKAFVKQTDAEIASDEEQAEFSGADGIREMVKAKLKVTVPDIMQRLQSIMANCLVALDEHHRGVQVRKGELVDKIEHEARIVRGKLENLAFTVASNPHGEIWRLHTERPSHESAWGNLVNLLRQLGGRDGWKKPLGPWLIDDVIPAIEWGLGSKLAEATRAEDAKRLEAIREAKEAGKAKAKAERTESVKLQKRSGKAKTKIAAPAIKTHLPGAEPSAEQPKAKAKAKAKAKSDPISMEVANAPKPKGVKRPTFLDGLAKIVESAEQAGLKL